MPPCQRTSASPVAPAGGVFAPEGAVIEAAPKGTKVEWYETDHALNDQAETDRLDWLSDRLGIG